jgi:hypothetical protein
LFEVGWFGGAHPAPGARMSCIEAWLFVLCRLGQGFNPPFALRAVSIGRCSCWLCAPHRSLPAGSCGETTGLEPRCLALLGVTRLLCRWDMPSTRSAFCSCSLLAPAMDAGRSESGRWPLVKNGTSSMIGAADCFGASRLVQRIARELGSGARSPA